MGDSACLLHAFSYPSAISDEPKLGNPMFSLGDSVSFGRFQTESLSWDKWSVFSHNRYVEDAQRYAQPGSVAQKKAFFEAHYKKIASMKKAAALSVQEPDAQSCDVSNPQVDVKKPEMRDDSDLDVGEKGSCDSLEVGEVKEAEVAVDHEIRVENPIQNESSKAVTDVLEISGVSEVEELGVSPPIEKPLLEGLKTSQEDPCLPSKEEKPELLPSNTSIHKKEPKIPAPPAKPPSSKIPSESIHKKEPKIPAPPAKPPSSKIPSKKESNLIQNPPKAASKSLHSLIYSTQAQELTKAAKTPQVPKSCQATPSDTISKKEPAYITSKTPSAQDLQKSSASQVPKSCHATPSEAISKKKPAFSTLKKPSAHQRGPKVAAISVRQSAIVHAKKERKFTPVTGNTGMGCVDQKRPGSRSLRTLIYPTAAKEPERPTTPVAQKGDSSRIALSTRKGSKTPLRPLVTASVTGVGLSKNTSSTTPCSEKKSCSKSLSAFTNKLQSPSSSSTPFRLRTEERAARRKQKLEDKFNAKETEKVQLQTSLKEKAGIELRKLRQSLCFKARPLPDFYKDRETIKVDTTKNTKIPLTRLQSPKLGRKSSTSTVEAVASQPQETKNSNPKTVEKKKSNKKVDASVPETMSNENKSPNISAVIR